MYRCFIKDFENKIENMYSEPERVWYLKILNSWTLRQFYNLDDLICNYTNYVLSYAFFNHYTSR